MIEPILCIGLQERMILCDRPVQISAGAKKFRKTHTRSRILCIREQALLIFSSGVSHATLCCKGISQAKFGISKANFYRKDFTELSFCLIRHTDQEELIGER